MRMGILQMGILEIGILGMGEMDILVENGYRAPIEWSNIFDSTNIRRIELESNIYI